MISEAFAQLKPGRPRTFLPERIDLANKDNVTEQLQRLLDRPIESAADFEQFILDRSELEAALAQQQSILYIQMTCHTDDPGAAGAYQAFIEQVVPAIKPYADKLDRRCIEADRLFPLDRQRYGVYLKAIETDISLFRSENVPLQTEESLLSQQYQKTTGGMTVHFRGSDYPVPQMMKFLLEPDRQTREQAWRATAETFVQQRDTLDDIFDKMIRVRHRIAQNAGFASYRDYKFKDYHRFSYTPADCFAYHEAVEVHIVPIMRKMQQRRAGQMQLDEIRPWDLEADPLSLPPLKPADSFDEFLAGTKQMFDRVLDRFGSQFAFMMDAGLLDLQSRKGKAPGGYQSTLNESRVPFIFMNAIGANDDLRVLTHEGGHAFHALACADDPLLAYRHAPMEFCEVASMSMELLAAAHLDVFYNEHDQKRWWRNTFEKTVKLLIQVAVFDAFQHWIYENPEHTRQQRNEKWLALNERFGTGLVNWDGLKDIESTIWHRVLHFYQVPFYYIEYGIAQLGALGVWLRSRQDYADAVNRYRQALTLGGSRPLPELFEAAGLPFDFSLKTVQPIAELLETEWKSILQ